MMNWAEVRHLDIEYECGFRNDPDYEIFKILIARTKYPRILKSLDPDLHLYTHSIEGKDFYRSAYLVEDSEDSEDQSVISVFVNNRHFYTKYTVYKTYSPKGDEQVWINAKDKNDVSIGQDRPCLRPQSTEVVSGLPGES